MLVQPVEMVLLVVTDPLDKENRVTQDLLERKALREIKDQLEMTERPVQRDQRVSEDIPDLLVKTARMESLVRQERLDRRVKLVKKVSLVQRESQEGME